MNADTTAKVLQAIAPYLLDVNVLRLTLTIERETEGGFSLATDERRGKLYFDVERQHRNDACSITPKTPLYELETYGEPLYVFEAPYYAPWNVEYKTDNTIIVWYLIDGNYIDLTIEQNDVNGLDHDFVVCYASMMLERMFPTKAFLTVSNATAGHYITYQKTQKQSQKDDVDIASALVVREAPHYASWRSSVLPDHYEFVFVVDDVEHIVFVEREISGSLDGDFIESLASMRLEERLGKDKLPLRYAGCGRYRSFPRTIEDGGC